MVVKLLLYKRLCLVVLLITIAFLVISYTNLSKFFWNAQPVILQPVGGLGNQLFQFSAAYALARNRNSYLYICLPNDWKNSMKDEHLTQFDANDRSILLWAFDISYEKVVMKSKIDCKNMENDLKIKVFADEMALLSSDTIATGKMVFLSGYFESETFFKSYKKEIRQQLTLKPMISDELEIAMYAFASAISTTESVAVHVRRRDFNSVSDYRVLPISYYQVAINKMKIEYSRRAAGKSLTFFVFSDDIDQVKLDFEIIAENFVFVSNKDLSRLADFMLMIMCEHIIIANSTFSWWAAYLNKHENNIVIAPMPKFSKQNRSFNEQYAQIYGGKLTYPDKWLTINPFKE